MKAKKSIKSIPFYAEGKGGKGKGIKMSSNETPFLPEPVSRKALIASIRTINRYPEKEPLVLKNLIAKKYSLKAENIILGNGSDELMQFVFMAFVEKGDNVIIPAVTFLMYGIYADIFGVQKKIVPMKEHAIDLGGILKKINSRTKAVFIANPNNPTGLFITRSSMQSFIRKVPANVLVVIDGAYMDFSEKNYEKDFADFIKKGKKNIVFLRTFSKSFGMAGLRLGYSVSDRETSAVLNAMRQPFNINSFALAFSEAILRRESVIHGRIKEIRSMKKDMEAFFMRHGVSFLPSEANFFCLKLSGANKFFEFCRTRGLFIRLLDSFGLPGYIRVSLSYKKDNIVFKKCLLEFLKKK